MMMFNSIILESNISGQKNEIKPNQLVGALKQHRKSSSGDQ